jgi:hypothetical protein
MRTARSFSNFAAAAILLAGLAAAGSAAAAMPETENGRYTLSTTADGVLRLDTRTGAVSTRSNGLRDRPAAGRE